MPETQIKTVQAASSGENPSQPKQRAITKWSMLALLVVVTGTAATLGIGHMWMVTWAGSGQAFPIGKRVFIDLPKGETLVWYESPYSVPVDDVTLLLMDGEGERIKAVRMTSDVSYSLTLSRKSARALWKIDVPRAGMHEIVCFNHNFASDAQIPPEDRVVFLKTPDTLAQASWVSKVVQITIATAFFTLAIVFYILHGLALRKRRALMA